MRPAIRSKSRRSLMPEINGIGVIGGGVMGSGIAQALAVGGARVTVRDLNEQLIEKSRSTIVDGRYGLKRGVERGKTTQGGLGRGAGAAVVHDKPRGPEGGGPHHRSCAGRSGTEEEGLRPTRRETESGKDFRHEY